MPAVSPHRSPDLARRQAVLSRISSATEATRSLEALLARPPQGDDAPIDPDGLMVSAARALLGVLQRSAGGELLVSLGPDHLWGVRIRQDERGPSVELVRRPGPAAGPDPAPPPQAPAAGTGAPGGEAPAERPTPQEAAVAAQLAELLRTRGAGA